MKNVILMTAILAIAGGSAALAHEGGKHDGKGHEKMFEKVDTNKDGNISKAESDAFHEAKFKEMDANNDGAVSKDEAKAHHEKKRAEWKAKKAAKEQAGGEKAAR